MKDQPGKQCVATADGISNDGTVEETKKSSIGVRFQPEVDVQEIPNCSDFSSNVIYRCWYSQDELLKLQPKCLNYTDRKRLSKVCCSANECLRGLEGRLTNRLGRYLSKKTPQLATYAVMDEQDLQRRTRCSNGRDGQAYYDPDALALVYGNITKSSQEEALALALMDEMYVQNHVLNDQDRNEDDRDDEDSCSSTSLKKTMKQQKHLSRSTSVLSSNSPDYDHIKLCTCFEPKPPVASPPARSHMSPRSPKLKRRTWKSEPRNLPSATTSPSSSPTPSLSPKVGQQLRNKLKIKSPISSKKLLMGFTNPKCWSTLISSNNNSATATTISSDNTSNKKRNTTCATTA